MELVFGIARCALVAPFAKKLYNIGYAKILSILSSESILRILGENHAGRHYLFFDCFSLRSVRN